MAANLRCRSTELPSHAGAGCSYFEPHLGRERRYYGVLLAKTRPAYLEQGAKPCGGGQTCAALRAGGKNVWPCIHVSDKNASLPDAHAIRRFLHERVIFYECWSADMDLPADATGDRVLAACDLWLEPFMEKADTAPLTSCVWGRIRQISMRSCNRFSHEHIYSEGEVLSFMRVVLVSHGAAGGSRVRCALSGRGPALRSSQPQTLG